ncbi:hypothetical protein [Nocardia sp. NPDC005366]|uniref:phage terminase large subunit family protein n=1 Tax=Nocardia sp. NPDC005366 TaxID=3156878 RepID=UPI0033AA09F3
MKIGEYLEQFPRDLVSSSVGRQLLTRNDPLLFAILYCSHHLAFEGEQPSLSQFHLDLAEYGKGWMSKGQGRDCWIAPRQSGKSTWLFTILPLWAAAHGHLKFIAAFSDSADQATKHLQTFKNELDTNDLLRKDYPKLCKPLMSGAVKRYISQSNQEIQQDNGFSFVAKGIDSKSLGLKIGNTRPDLLLLDDIEPNESNYSAHEARKRLRTVLDSVFYLNDRAHIVLVGTTVMSGSIIDQLRKVGDLRAEFDSLSQHVDIPNDLDPEPLTADKCLLSGVRTSEQSEQDSDSGIYSPRRANRYAISHPVAGYEIKSASVESGAYSDSSTFDDVDDELSSSDQSGKSMANAIQSLSFASSQMPRLDNSSDECVTTGEENGFKSFGLFSDTSIPTSHIEQPADFKAIHDAELSRLTGPKRVNRGEDQAETSIEPIDFYDSLDDDLRWIADEKISVHYYPAIVIGQHGDESSWWPEFKSLDELNRIRHTRAFQMNYQNKPVNIDAAYWSDQDIEIGEAQDYKYTLLSVDPAVSTKTTNDYTALVIVSLGFDGMAYVRHAEQVRYVSTQLRDKVNELIDRYDVGLLLCETNQGGMLWKSVFDGIKCRYKPIHQTEPKAVRAGRALDYYRKNKVRHTRHFGDLEEQMYSFPKVVHDDLVDALSAGTHYFLTMSSRPKVTQQSYL